MLTSSAGALPTVVRAARSIVGSLFKRESGPDLEAALAATGRLHQLVDSGRVAWTSAALADLCGDGRSLPEWLEAHAGQEPEQRSAVARLLESGSRKGREEKLVLPLPETERQFWCVRAEPLPGRPGLTLWSLEEVKEERRPAADEDEEADLRSLLEQAPLGYYAADREGRLLHCNQTLVSWLGLSEDLLKDGKIPLHRFLPEDAAALVSPDSLLTRGDAGPAGEGEARRGEVELVDAEGGSFLAHATEQTHCTPEGAWQTRGVLRHLSREQAASEALAQTELRFRRLFDEAPVGIAQLDAAGLITECNKAFGAMVGMTAERAAGRSLLELVPEAQRAHVARAIQQARTALSSSAGASAPTVTDVQVAFSSQAVASLSLRSFREEGDREGEEGLVAHLLDLSEQKALEAQFAQSQKMQAVGQLAGGIAHDFNNLLTAMIGFSDLLLLRHRPGDQSFADIMQIKQNANRAANLVRQLLAFSRQQTLQPRVLNITDIRAEITHLLRRLIGERIELKVVHGRDLGPVKADQGQLEQVIINLAVNARDAMPDGGRLLIRTSNIVLEEDLRSRGESLPRGSYVLLEVEDSGHGIPPENLSRVFEPFFSTKEVGEGTGLGLSTVYGIVKQTGGFVFVDSEVGAGTRFSIYLPRHAREQAVDDPEARRPRDLTGRGRVLLVEDEEAVRAFSARALRNKGYEVIEASSGELALEQLQGDADVPAIDLLITDVVMPRVDGPALVQRAREKMPDLKVIYISGYAEDSFRSRVDSEQGIYFLPKPFSLKQLAQKVKEVMGDPDVLQL